MNNGLSLAKISALIDSSNESKQLAFGACVDSRLINAGDLFFACEGVNSDGHHFLAEAARKNASAAVVKQEYQGESFGLPLLRVKSPEKALQQLASKILTASPAKVIAITGSAGKTTTKDFLAQLLASKYHVVATPGNYNSQLGLPLTILNHLQEDVEIIVLEMGMTRAGHIASLVKIAPPDIAVITGVSLAHAENFESLDSIVAAKAEILSNVKTKLGIIDHQISSSQAITNRIESFPLWTFGFGDSGVDADFSGVYSEGAFELLHHGLRIAQFDSLPFSERHNLHNFIAAAVAAHECGVEWELLHQAAKTLILPPMRCQVHEVNGIIIVNDSYNAQPIAIKAALDSLPRSQFGGKRIAVLSEMRELGAFSEQCHKEIAEYALPLIDVLICVGRECFPMYELWSASGKPVFWLKDLAEILTHLSRLVYSGDVVLIKGSRSSGFSSLVETYLEKQQFPLKIKNS